MGTYYTNKQRGNKETGQLAKVSQTTIQPTFMETVSCSKKQSEQQKIPSATAYILSANKPFSQIRRNRKLSIMHKAIFAYLIVTDRFGNLRAILIIKDIS